MPLPGFGFLFTLLPRYPCDRIFPLTSLSLSATRPSFFLRPKWVRLIAVEDTASSRTIYRALISIAPEEASPHFLDPPSCPLESRFSGRIPSTSVHCCTIFAPSVCPLVRPSDALFSVCILVIFRRHPPRVTARRRLALYLNGRRVIYIIDSRNAPVGIRNDFIFKRGNRLTQF